MRDRVNIPMISITYRKGHDCDSVRSSKIPGNTGGTVYIPCLPYYTSFRLFWKKHAPTANRLVYIPSGWLSTIPASMSKSKIDLPRLAQYLIDHVDEVFAFSDLEFLLVKNSDQWNLPPSMTPKKF